MQQYRKHLFYIVLIVFLFAGGLIIRLYDLQDAPLDFHPTRQLHSALMARGIYYFISPNLEVSEWQRVTGIHQWKLEGLVEPPLLEWLVAFTYKLVSGVYLWIARLYAILFWMLAAVGVWWLAKKISGQTGSVIALSFFLYYPYGVYASRSFQPETLLVAFLVFTILSVLQWEKHKNWKWAIATGLIGGITILIKAVAIFFVAGIWLGLLFSHMKLKAMIKNRQLWIIACLLILPYALFIYYATYIVGGYEGQFSLRFFPQMWTQIGFYLRWIGTLRLAVGLEWLVMGLLGVLLIKERNWRWILLGAWLGYVLLGFTLSYHISTHDYYNLPVYIMTALGLGVMLNKLVSFNSNNVWVRFAAISLLILVISTYSYESYSLLKRNNFNQEIAFWQTLGEELGHEARIVALSEDYGYRLAYWGWISPTNWMNTEDIRLRKEAGQTFDFERYFNTTIQDKDYFVITLLNELEKQPQLNDHLCSHFKIIKQSDRLIVFDLRTPL